MPTEKNLSNLVINKIESKEVYNYMVANNLVNEDEMYLVQGDDEIKIVVDSELNDTSENPVQNKVVTEAISDLQDLVGDTSVASQISTATANKVDKVDGKSLSTNDYTTTEKNKLAGISDSADSVSFSQSLTNGTKVGTITINGVGTDLYAPTDTDTHYTSKNVVGSTSTSTSAAMSLANGNVYLNHVENGAVTSSHNIIGSGATTVTTDSTGKVVVTSTNTTYSNATTSTAGLMSTTDKAKLDGIASGATNITVDSALSSTSTNPVQNKVVNTAITNLSALVGDTAVSTQITNAIINKSDSGHTHDDRYYTEEEIDTKLGGKSDTGHTHDDRYYTETEIDAKLDNKVDKVEGSRLITASEATKLESLVLGDSGQVEVSGKVNANNVEGLDELLATKVDKVTGMGLSTNDYTTDEKNKLAGIEAGANKTVVDTALSSTSTNPVQNKVVNTAITNLNTLVGDTSVSSQISSAIVNKVDKVDGKGLSTNDYTTDEKNKLAGIAAGAEVNQSAFSNVVVGSTTIAADSKTDTLTIVAGDNITLTPDATNDQLTIAAKDTVYTHPTYTSRSSGLYKVTVDSTGHVSAATSVVKSDITALGIPAQDTTYSMATQSTDGLMSSSDKTKLDGIETGANKTIIDSVLSSTSTNPVQNKVVNTAISNLNTLVGDTSVSSQITDAIDGLNLSSTYIAATQKGAANGLAELDSTGKVPSAQLPSYVDDVLEYSAKSSFPSTGETGKIYVDTTTNLTYRWSGSAYVEISPSLALGTTSSTAFRGDYGNTAYTHATAKGSAFAAGLYKITTNDQGHVTAATAVAKSDITGLGIPAQDTTYGAATTSEAGLMSASDKAKLDGIATGANKTTVDSALNSTSTNPVQNKVVNTAIANLNTLVGDTAVSEQISAATDNCITEMSVSGKVITYTKGNGSTGTITTQDTDTTYANATTSAAGLMSASDKSKLDGIAEGADTVSFSQSLTSGTKVGTITINGAGTDLYAPTNTDTHYTAKNIIGSSPTDTANVTTATRNPYLSLVENGEIRSTHRISGVGATIVQTDANGNITIRSTNTTYSDATTSTSGLMSAADKTSLDNLNTLVGDTAVSEQISSAVSTKADIAQGTYAITTEGDGAAYTATVPSITSLTAGVSFIMIPHVVSTTTTPTLNVNGLGAKNIRRRLSSVSTGVQTGYAASWLAKGLPFRVVYDGNQWIVEGSTRPAATDLYGKIDIGAQGKVDGVTEPMLIITDAEGNIIASTTFDGNLTINGDLTVNGTITATKVIGAVYE